MQTASSTDARKPAVAGQFYPGTNEQLQAFLADAVHPASSARAATAVISPHAGYIYSGGVAGTVFSRVRVPDTVLLLGPNHTGMGAVAAVDGHDAWSTPLGPVLVDQALAGELIRECKLLEADNLAHLREHSLEVQLPFLQCRNPQVSIVPVAFMLRSFREIEEVGGAIARVLQRWPKPVLMVVSSDMSHYESQEIAEEKDRLAIDRVLALDARGLLEVTRDRHITMCGVIPAAVMLVAAAQLGASGGELLEYTTSGAASGDYDRVVGYAGILVR